MRPVDSIESAIGVLSAGEAADCSLALAYSRDVAPQDRFLWDAALAYFETRAPERHWTYFGAWLSRTLEAGQPAELAVRRLLSRIEPCDRSIGLLENLGQIASEPRFKNLKPWCASQAGLWLELARGWSEQPACSSLYHCSHNLFLRLARIMSPLLRMSDRSDLSLQCLKAILRHQVPPQNSSFLSFPASMVDAMGVECLAPLLNLLETAANRLDLATLKSFKKKKASDPTNEPSVQLCFNALIALVAHPDWELTEADSLRIPRTILWALVEILYHLPEQKFQLLPNETKDAFVERLSPLQRLLELCRP